MKSLMILLAFSVTAAWSASPEPALSPAPSRSERAKQKNEQRYQTAKDGADKALADLKSCAGGLASKERAKKSTEKVIAACEQLLKSAAAAASEGRTLAAIRSASSARRKAANALERCRSWSEEPRPAPSPSASPAH